MQVQDGTGARYDTDNGAWWHFTVAPPATPADHWTAQYYNNTTLTGGPVLVQDEGTGFIDHEWGGGSPPGVQSDNFSARWTRTLYFSAGRYRFTVVTDDGSCLYVDGQNVLDYMDRARYCTANFELSTPACDPEGWEEIDRRYNGGEWDPVECACHYWWLDPLVLTLDGGPTRLTRAVDGVMFDANGDGRPDRVAWTRTGAGVAFLVVDLNGNGVIDNVTEMLGQAVWVELDPAPEDRTISVVSNLSGIGSIARAAQGGLLAAVRAGGQKSRPG